MVTQLKTKHKSLPDKSKSKIWFIRADTKAQLVGVFADNQKLLGLSKTSTVKEKPDGKSFPLICRCTAYTHI